MNTWTAEQPPTLPPATLLGKVIGGCRIALMLLITLVAVGLFLTGRALRAALGRWVTFHFGVAWLWSRGCLRLSGVRLRIFGQVERSGALVANHSSWLDILALRSVGLIYFVSKAEVANWPGIGFITRITGTVFIERRRSQAKAQEVLLRERIAAKQLLCFFPEGTSTDGRRVLPFKSSLFAAFFEEGKGTNIRIQPVTVRYQVSDRDGQPPAFYGWWGTMGFESHIWDVVTRSFRGGVEVIIHPAVRAEDFADRKELADYCQRQVAFGFEHGRVAVPIQSAAASEGGQNA